MFELRSLFATFESLKYVKFPMYPVVQNSNSKHFYSNDSWFQITLSLKLHCNYMQLYIVKNNEFKQKRSLVSEKYKEIAEVESGIKPPRIAEKYGVPRNSMPTWLLPGNEERIKSAFQSGEFSTKGKIVRVSLRRSK